MVNAPVYLDGALILALTREGLITAYDIENDTWQLWLSTIEQGD